MNAFNWKNVDLNLLVAFQALYRTRSVSMAAQTCRVSQSAMSHTLQRMRVLFEDPLFERIGSRMEPTHRAQEMAGWVDSILATVRAELLTKKMFSAEAYDGIWRIGLTDYAEQLFAPNLYDEIKRVSPDSQISFYHVNRSNYVELTEKEQLDVLIGSVSTPNLRFQYEKLYTERHVSLFDPQQLPFTKAITLKQFASVEHAVVSPDGALQTQLDDTLESLGVIRRVSVVSRNFLTIWRLVRGRKLICTLPKRFARDSEFTQGLKALPTPVAIDDFDIQLFYLRSQRHDLRNIWLRNVVQAVVSPG